MRRLACTQCGSTLEWDGASSVVTCQFCGSRFQMNVGGKAAQDGDWQRAALRGGDVTDRPSFEQDENFGKVYYRCWLPKGWRYRVASAPLERAVSMGTPCVPEIIMWSGDGSAKIRHTTSNAFQDLGNAFGDRYGSQLRQGPLGGFINGLGSMAGAAAGNLGTYAHGQVGMDGLIHYPTCTVDPSTWVRQRALVSAAEYCDEIAALEGLGQLQIADEQRQDPWVEQRMQAMLATQPPEVRQNYWYEWCRRGYIVQTQSGPYVVVAEVQISTNGFNVQRGTGTQQVGQSGQGRFAQMLGGFGQAMGQAMSQMATPRLWQVDYEMVLVTPQSEFQANMTELEHVRSTIELGRDFAQAQEHMRNFLMQEAQKSQALMSNAMMQMQADRNASWDRMNATIRDTHDYTMGVMHDMQASNAATHDRVARWQSESIRGVNTYAGMGGPVEASTRWDHVYQGVPRSSFGSDTYVGVEGDWLEPGVDFVELPRI